MGIGRLYSMPTNQSNTPLRSSSIHLFVNGFSFCTPTKTEYIPTPEGAKDFDSTVEELLNYYPKSLFEHTQIISYQHPATFIPIKFFDEKYLAEYLSFSGKTDLEQILNFDVLNTAQTVTVYTTPKKTLELLNRHLSQSSLCHYSSLLFEEIIQISKSVDSKDQLFVHLHKDGMDLFLIEINTVRFYNHFTIKNEDEFLYYLFFVVEQYALKTDTFEIIFLGQIQVYNSYYEALKQYHSKIRFETKDSNTVVTIDQHPAPYMAEYSV